MMTSAVDAIKTPFMFTSVLNNHHRVAIGYNADSFLNAGSRNIESSDVRGVLNFRAEPYLNRLKGPRAFDNPRIFGLVQELECGGLPLIEKGIGRTIELG
jgi:hypothetical protein